jgi:hypothetical protein
MARDDIASRIHDWVNRGDAAVAELMPLHAALNDVPGAHHHRRALMVLSTACLGSTGSVLHLVDAVRLWDGELVMRSVVEGSVKFGYLLESERTFIVRCIEYHDALPAITRLRRHTRAAEALKALEQVDDEGVRPLRDLLLSDDELAEINAAYPRETRRKIEQRWGFTALVEAVSKRGRVFGPTARSWLHTYSTASELQHMTFEGASMPLERDRRPNHRRAAIELAHAARLIDDCFHLTFLRVFAIFRFLRRDPRPLFEVELRQGPFLAELAEARREWEQVEYGSPLEA